MNSPWSAFSTLFSSLLSGIWSFEKLKFKDAKPGLYLANNHSVHPRTAKYSGTNTACALGTYREGTSPHCLRFIACTILRHLQFNNNTSMEFTGMEFTMKGLDSFFAPLRFAESLTRRTQLDSSQAVSRGVSGGPAAIWAFERGEGRGVHTSDEDRGSRRASLTPHPLGSAIGSLSL